MSPLRSLPALILLFCLAGTLAAEEPDPRYWRLDQIQAQFQAWELAYPAIFRADTLGLSGEGRAIPMARISDNVAFSEDEPRLLFHAAQHANECNGTGAVMKSMQALLEGYGCDPAVTARVDSLELCFVPIRNVDGHLYVFGGAPNWADWRKTLRDNNANGQPDFPDDGVDTNRNWDWFWDDHEGTDPSSQKYKGPFPFSEPEVVALRDWVLEKRPVIVVDYHSPVTISWTNYVFYCWSSQHGWGQSPDYEVAGDIARDWADATRTLGGSRFNAIFTWDSLPKEQCWIYGNTGILAYIMEIADQCWFTGADVDSIAARVARGSETLMDRVLQGPGIEGRVTDARTGLPLVANVELVEMNGDEIAPRLTEAGLGLYHRLTFSGSYTVQVSCEGYEPQTRSVSTAPGRLSRADFQLQPDMTAAEEASLLPQPRILAANPLRAGGRLRLDLPAGSGPGRAELLDLRGRRVALLDGNLAAGRIHELRLPAGLSSGIYLLRLSTGASVSSRRLLLLR